MTGDPNNEQKYRTLFRYIAVGVFRSTPGPEGRFLEVNPALARMLGYEDERDLMRMKVADLYQRPSDRMEFSERLSREGILRQGELELRRKDGSPIVVSETAVAVKDADGNVIHFDGTIEDITERKRAEKQLLVQKAYFETLFANAPEAIILHTNEDSIRDVNREFTRMFGYEKSEVVGRAIDDIVAPDEFREEAADISRRVLGGERVEIDTKRKRKDGSLIDVSVLGAPIVIDGRQEGDYAIYRDITQRKKAEQDVLVQKTYFEKLFNSAPEAIILHDNDDVVVNVNEEFCRMFGYTSEEAIGRPINSLVAPGELLPEAAGLSSAVIHGERVEIDTRRRMKDGTLFDVWILGAPIFLGGKQIGVYAIYRDITQRRKAEEDILVQKTYLEKLFNSAPEAIVLHDNDDVVVNVNEEFCRMFGWSRDEAIGKPINSLVASEEFQAEASGLSSKVIHGERVEADTRRRRKDGTLIDVWILGAPIFLGGKQMGVYAIYRDITERRKAEEARIRLKEEARMARNIQLNFLPKGVPDVDGYEIAGKSIPALNVGGDYYDFIRLDADRYVVSLGDVSGNGLAAALVMANLQATIRGQAMFDPEPARLLERANRLLYRSTNSRTFISLFYGILDAKNHTLVYANAGQDLPILFSPGNGSRTLTVNGIVLGVMEDAVYRQEEVAIGAGDRLLLYTDGIPETMNDYREQFGADRLAEIVRRERAWSVRTVIENIFTAVRRRAPGRRNDRGDDRAEEPDVGPAQTTADPGNVIEHFFPARTVTRRPTGRVSEPGTCPWRTPVITGAPRSPNMSRKMRGSVSEGLPSSGLQSVKRPSTTPRTPASAPASRRCCSILSTR
jgi:PAS domain S-box-containing protein